MTKSEVALAMARLERNEVEWGSVFTDRMLVREWTRGEGWGRAEIRPYGKISLAPSASVFNYGLEVFEGMKAYKDGNGGVCLFRPELNIRRLNVSARRMALPDVDEEEMLALIRDFVGGQMEWVPAVEGSSLYIRPCIVATGEKIGVRRSDSAMLFVIASPVGSFFGGGGVGLLRGVRLMVCTEFFRAWRGGVGYCKTGGNYAMSIGPTEEAKEKGFDQILWLSDGERKLVTEVGMMNVFFVFEGVGGRVLVTPRLDGTILDGVTRRCVIELAGEMGWQVEERDVELEEVWEGVGSGKVVEVFGTGTGAGICPVASLSWGGETVEIKEREEVGDVSVVLRERLREIWGGGEGHRWMVPVGVDRKSGKETVSGLE